MAPRKRKAEAQDGDDQAPAKAAAATAANAATTTATTTAATTRRVTRSLTKQTKADFSSNSVSLSAKRDPRATKKGKTSGTRKIKAEEEVAKKAEGVNGKAPKERAQDEQVKSEVDDATSAANTGAKTIIIEHCKQCNSFKTRAFQVKSGLENGVPGITVVVNPDKPRRGCFEIREEGGDKFISLLDMKRPFAPMKALDMDKVISDIIEKVKA